MFCRLAILQNGPKHAWVMDAASCVLLLLLAPIAHGQARRHGQTPADSNTNPIVRGARPDPGSLSSFRGQNLQGMSLLFDIVGATSGSVWGVDIYTDDSRLAAAAVHAGVVEVGQRAIVRVVFLPGRRSYRGASRNGVRSSSYGEWKASYRLELVRKLGRKPAGKRGRKARPKGTLPDPGTLSAYRGRNSQSFLFQVTGSKSGTVWGTDVYTDDSRLAAAAVHAAILRPGETAVVRVTILPGRRTYKGASRHGVSSHQYGSWGGSYKIERAKQSAKIPNAKKPRAKNARRKR